MGGKEKSNSYINRGELLLEFNRFIEISKKASEGLTNYNSRISGTARHISATNRWTMRALNDIAFRNSSRGAIQLYVRDKLPWLFSLSGSTEKALVDRYIEHTREVQEDTNKALAEAEEIRNFLTDLDKRLHDIHHIVTRENGDVLKSKEELLSQLWTMLGGNRGTLNEMDRNLKLLGEVGNYHKNAYAHVTDIIFRLQEMKADLEDLQKRVSSSPEHLRGRADVPLFIHMDIVLSGYERFEASTNQAKRLRSDYLKKLLGPDCLECEESVPRTVTSPVISLRPIRTTRHRDKR